MPESEPLLATLLAAVQASVDENRDLRCLEWVAFHDPEVPLLAVLKRTVEGVWYTERSAVNSAVKLISLAASHILTDKARAIDLVMKGQYKTAAQRYPELALEPLEYVLSRLAGLEAHLAKAKPSTSYGLGNPVYREALEAMVTIKSTAAADYALRHLGYDTAPLIAQLGTVVVQPLCRFAEVRTNNTDARASAILVLQMLRDPTALETLSLIAERDNFNLALSYTHIVNLGKSASEAIAAIRDSTDQHIAELETLSKQPATALSPASSETLGGPSLVTKGSGTSTWNGVKEKYGQYISGDPEDCQTFAQARLHTFYRDARHAESVLGRISDDAAARLRQVNAGVSSESGEQRYHVVHEGTLTGKQIKEYLVSVVNGGGDIWEVIL